jgi:putative ATPase
MEAPLAERIRPQKTRRLYKSIPPCGTKWLFNPTNSKGIIPSLILWGPPGTGKNNTNHSTGIKTPFYILSAINSGVKDIREVIEKRNKVEVFSPPRIHFIYR